MKCAAATTEMYGGVIAAEEPNSEMTTLHMAVFRQLKGHAAAYVTFGVMHAGSTWSFRIL